MNKYASQFNELIVLAEKEGKSKKKGGSMASVLKLVQDLAEFEGNIQEAIDAQEMAENRSQIEGFLTDIDKMYEVLLNMAKASIQSMRSARANPLPEGTEEVEQVEQIEEPKEATTSSFSKEDLQKQMDAKPKSPVSVNIPTIPTM